ncbi:MAG: orotate phosphoribosyltransferase [Candidatus Omnitrophica bacterium]|nr:orotate phosphoribosyltransferase [Candidatus Omnitrophota bacterium]MCB9747557.1 orotate phosphoribosyltransferase [Candidatus Omnitrophota bacterium]
MKSEMRTELLELIKDKAYFREKITLSSGKESDYYIDARLITLTSKGAYLCAELMLDLIKDDDYKSIGGPTLGADPLIGAVGVVSLQRKNPINTFIIRKTSKGHGKKQLIEGPPLTKGDRVVIIDDVATTGKAFLYSIDVLKELGIEVVKAVCIVDRQEGAAEAVKAKGVELVSIFKAEEIHVN